MAVQDVLGCRCCCLIAEALDGLSRLLMDSSPGCCRLSRFLIDCRGCYLCCAGCWFVAEVVYCVFVLYFFCFVIQWLLVAEVVDWFPIL